MARKTRRRRPARQEEAEAVTEAQAAPPGAPAAEVKEVPLTDIDLEDTPHEYRLDPRIGPLQRDFFIFCTDEG